MPPKFSSRSIELPWEKWDFSQLSPDEGHICSIYEYAVSSAWFKTSVLEWRERTRHRFVTPSKGGTFGVEYQDALDEANTCCPLSLAHLSELVKEFAEGATLAFSFYPEKPWQRLTPIEKWLVKRIISHCPREYFDEGYDYLKLLVQHFAEVGSFPVSWMNEGSEAIKADLEEAELYVFRINSGTSRDQLKKAFTTWMDRSGRFPNTHGAGKEGAIKSKPEKQLVCLAVKRLTEAYADVQPLRTLIDAATDLRQLHDWLPKSENRWHDYKKQATAFSNKILPPPPENIPGP